MPEHQPAPFPPRQLAEHATVVVHRRRNVGRDETEIERRRYGERVGNPQAEHAQRGNEKRDSTPPAAQSPSARPVGGFGISQWHQVNSTRSISSKDTRAMAIVIYYALAFAAL